MDITEESIVAVGDLEKSALSVSGESSGSNSKDIEKLNKMDKKKGRASRGTGDERGKNKEEDEVDDLQTLCVAQNMHKVKCNH